MQFDLVIIVSQFSSDAAHIRDFANITFQFHVDLFQP